jgi:hypothetical protein
MIFRALSIAISRHITSKRNTLYYVNLRVFRGLRSKRSSILINIIIQLILKLIIEYMLKSNPLKRKEPKNISDQNKELLRDSKSKTILMDMLKVMLQISTTVLLIRISIKSNQSQRKERSFMIYHQSPISKMKMKTSIHLTSRKLMMMSRCRHKCLLRYSTMISSRVCLKNQMKNPY